MRIDVLLYDGFDEIDAIGPFEVLSTEGVEVRLAVLGEPREVRSQRGVRIGVEHALGTPDGVIVPGGGWLNRAPEGAWAEAQRGDLGRALTERAPDLGWIASVCSGSMLLGSAGLLEGAEATTNHALLDALAPLVGTVRRERVVDDGDRITAGGLTAGLDLGLWLLERFLGTATADRRAEQIEYVRQGRVWRAAPRG